MANIESQFLGLWQQNKEILNSSSSELLNSYREQASKDLVKLGIPKYKSEDYQRIDIDGILSRTWSLDYKNEECKYTYDINNNYCDLLSDDTVHLRTINNRVINNDDTTELEEQGIFIGSLVAFSNKYPQIAKKYYNKIAKKHQDGIISMNTMLVQDGFVVYVPKGIKAKRNIQILNIINSKPLQMINRRMLIIAEEDSKVMVLSCDNMNSDIETLSMNVVEIYAEKNAEIDLTILEETTKKCNNISSIHSIAESKSKIVINGLTLFNGITRNNYYCDFIGEDANVVISGLAIGSEKQHIDNYSYINHSVGNCKCEELFKYVLSDKSYGVFTGRIYVAKDAQKTEAYQNNRNLLLSDKARMQSKPQLEIYADDVKCSHGMTTGQLDEEALFYMRQRGILPEEAKLLLSIAFTEDVIKNINLAPLRDRVRSIVESRFRNDKTILCGCKCHDNLFYNRGI